MLSALSAAPGVLPDCANLLLFWAKRSHYAARFSYGRGFRMAKRVEEIGINPFLAADGVATRLAVRELKAARIDPGPLLAKAGISRLKFAEEPKRVGAESQLRFLELAAGTLDNAVLGLQLAQRGDLRETGILYYVMAASHNLGEAVRNLVALSDSRERESARRRF